jgi:hypothetical protein
MCGQADGGMERTRRRSFLPEEIPYETPWSTFVPVSGHGQHWLPSTVAGIVHCRARSSLDSPIPDCHKLRRRGLYECDVRKTHNQSGSVEDRCTWESVSRSSDSKPFPPRTSILILSVHADLPIHSPHHAIQLTPLQSYSGVESG